MNILIAEDDVGCQGLLRELLIDEPDLVPTIVNDGAEAWWLLSDPARKFGLGIIDIHMPRVNGVELLTRIRNTPGLHKLPVILCTGMDDIQPVAQAAALSVTEYVVKPYRLADLLGKIKAIAAKG